MDQLDIDAKEARRLGLSYGKYIALYRPEKPPAVRYSKRQGGGELLCAQCGSPIANGSNRKKYCSQDCADEARRLQRQNACKETENDLELDEMQPEEKPCPACILCGKPIPAFAARRKYCSATCSDQALNEQRRQANLRRREASRLKAAET